MPLVRRLPSIFLSGGIGRLDTPIIQLLRTISQGKDKIKKTLIYSRLSRRNRQEPSWPIKSDDQQTGANR